MSQVSQIRTYERDSSVVFRKTKEAFGGLSNMAGGFPIDINGRRYRTSEALYQACRYPHMPEVQELVVSQRSPMTAKMKSRPYRKDSRSDWNKARVPIMKWCLRAKLLQNWSDFSELLLETGNRPIVEESRKDAFWGAKSKANGTLEGANVLGRLLMDLREKLKNDPESLQRIEPVCLPKFWLFRKQVPVLGVENNRVQADIFSSSPKPRENKPATDIKESSDMTRTYKKKLIEVAIPLEAINAASAREKSIRHGHPSTLHLWWARRPLAACRAVLFAQLVDDPSSHPDTFPTEEAVEAERKRLFQIIEDLVKWENSTNEEILERASAEIRKSCDGEMPPVYDPFSGGCSIPLEAQRLGLPAFGSDLNPVAVMIGKAMIEVPPSFQGVEPVHPGTHERNHYRHSEGLSEDIKYYGQLLREKARGIIGHLYPNIDLPTELGGRKAKVVAWIWARTVPSPDPSLQGLPVPLVRSLSLSSKKGKRSWVEIVIETSGYYFEVRSDLRGDTGGPSKGTIGRSGGICAVSGSAMPLNYVREQAKKGNLGAKLMAVVAEGTGGKLYLSPSDLSVPSAEKIFESIDFPVTPLPDQALGFRVQNYGILKHSDLFMDRQLAAMSVFSSLVEEVANYAVTDAIKSISFQHKFSGSDVNGCANAYGKAIATYLACAVGRAADFWSANATWVSSGEFVTHVFGRQALPMVWDYAEANPFSDGTGSWAKTCLDWVARAVEGFVGSVPGTILQCDATEVAYDENAVISSDPPYYDNIGYADLSDYFYIWVKRCLKSYYADLFRTILVPKSEELIAEPFRHGSKEEAEGFFLSGMKNVMKRMSGASGANFPITLYYAFKDDEIEEEGVSSVGWVTFIQAVLEANLSIVGTWPVRTERSARPRGHNSNALATSVVLVCRRRHVDAETISRSEFIRVLRREMPPALGDLQAANIAPADMPQSALGPGIGIFSRYQAVLESEDSPMTVKTALQLINRELDEFIGDIQGEFDADTRFTITWFEQNGYASGESGIAINIAQARGISVESVKHAGIIQYSAGKVRILKRDELLDDWEPASDSHLTIWECCQYLVRALEDEGEEAAALLIKKLGSDKVEAVKDLAYCLYDICSNKRSDAKEATAYNALIAVWTDLTRMAATIHDVRGDGQTSLNL